MIVLILPALLTGCRLLKKQNEIEAVVVDDTAYRQALVALLPDPPEVPKLPTLSWTFKEGLYGLDEKGVDLFLDFAENSLPGFCEDYLDWLAQLRIILEKLSE